MKKTKMWLVSLLVVLFVFALTGCSAGSTIDTTLYLNADMSGSRVMQVTLINDVFSQYFNGSVDDLSNLVAASCPGSMSYTYEYLEDAYHVYTFRLDFSSVQDYKTKVAAIMGVTPEELNVEIAMPDSVWATGVRIEESFSSADLLQWLKNAVVEAGYVSSSNAGYIFESGDTVVDVAGTVFPTGNQVYLNEVQYLAINNIDVLTTVHEDGTYDRTVYINIPQASMSAKGSEIEAYIGSCVPANATSNWEQTDTGSIAQISATNLALEGLQEFTATVFDAAENTAISVQEVSGTSPFVEDVQYSEYVDMANYATNQYGETMVRYMMKMDAPNSQIYGSYDNLGTSEEYPEYIQLFAGQVSAIDESLTLEKYYAVESVESDLSVGSIGSAKQTTTFTLDRVVEEEEQADILARFEQFNTVPSVEEEVEASSTVASDAADSDVSEVASEATSGVASEEPDTEESGGETYADISAKEQDDKTLIVVKQKGSLEELQEGLEAMPWSQVVQFGRDNKIWSLKNDVAVVYSVDYSSLLPYAGQDMPLTVHITAGFMSKLEDISGNYTSSGSGFELETTGTTVYLNLAGSQVNMVGVLLWVLTAGLVVCVFLVGLPLVKKMASQKKAAVPAGPVAAEPPAVPGTENQPDSGQSEAQTVPARFCTECGSPLQPDSAFCENCGAPVKTDDFVNV